jgi:maleate isomerase
MEPEFYKMLSKDFTVHTARMRLQKVTVTALTQMEKDMIKAAKELSDANVSVIAYGCTSGSLIRGIDHDRKIVTQIERVTKIPSISTAGAVVSALDALGVKRVAIATPYIKQINERERRFLTDNGFNVVDLRALGLVENLEIGLQEPDVAYDLARRLLHGEADGVFISCTNFRTIDIVERLEQEIGKPVITSNTATLWAMLRKAGLATRIEGLGGLLLR